MSEKQLEAAAPGGENNPESGKKPGWFGRLRTQPGFRTASIAFVLTVVLGIGGTAAYAYWSQSATVNITATTRSNLPANTAVVTAQPALATRPGTPSWSSCTAPLTHKQMENNKFADINFDWTDARGATSYVVTVNSTSTSYTFTDALTASNKKTVSGSAASFRFPRVQSKENGDPQPGLSPFYTNYAVRVMPMNGNVPGDPLYFKLLYAHHNNNCFLDEVLTGASPLGDTTLTCALPAFTADAGFVESKFTWTTSARATSYTVTLTAQNGSGYGGEQVVTGLNAAFRVMRPLPSNALGRYDVRVQPMRGTEAGDPRYLIYQLGANSHECWAAPANYRPSSSS